MSAKSDSEQPTSQPPRVLLGRIKGAHGIRGDVLIHSFTAQPAAISGYGALEYADGRTLPKLKVLRVTGRGVIGHFTGLDTRNAAEALKGAELWVARSRLPATRDEEFYHADLIGLTAVAGDGTTLGKVIAVENFGAGDLIALRLAGSRNSEFIPFTRACVPLIDIAARRLVIVRPEIVDGEPPEARQTNGDDASD